MAERVKNRANEILRVWEELADKILASILTDHAAYFPAADVVGNDVTLWPPKARPVWRGVLQCIEGDTLPTVEAIKLRLNGGTPDEYLDYLKIHWNDEDNARIIYHAEQMKQVGLLSKLRAVGRDLAAVDDIANVGEAVARADVGLNSITAIQADRRGDAKTVSDSAWAQVETFGGEGVKTGLPWFDNLAGGIWPGFNYWVVAAYKSGKSTLMRNIALNVARSGHPIGIFCAEGSRELFALDCQAMIASGLMLDRGVRTNRLRLSGLFIIRAYRKELLLTEDEYTALQDARRIWEALPVHIWDSKDNIRDRATVRHIVKRSKLDYGSQIYMYDHAQKMGNETNIYDKMVNTSQLVQDLSNDEGVAIWMLAQRNEAAVKGDSGHSSGVKGGGDADAAADFTLIPSIDKDYGGIKVKLKHSRHTAAGASETHITNPSSGLIIDRWLQTEREF